MDTCKLGSGGESTPSGNRQQMATFAQYTPQQFDYTSNSSRKPTYADSLVQQTPTTQFSSWSQPSGQLENSKYAGMDFWSSSLSGNTIAGGGGNNNNGSSASGYELSAAYSNSNDIYRKNKYAGVEMDQLSYQMLALNAAENSQLASPNTVHPTGFFNGSALQATPNLNDTSKLSYSKWASNGDVPIGVSTNSSYTGYMHQNAQQQQQQQQSYNQNTNCNNNTSISTNNAHTSVYKSQSNSNSNYPQSSVASQITQQSYNNKDSKSYDGSKHNTAYSYSKSNNGISKDFKSQSCSTNSTSLESNDIGNYKMKLQLKDIIIAKLESELEKEKDFQKAVFSSSNDNNNFEIPKNQEQLYKKLVETVQITKKELEDTKTRLESLVTAIALNPNSSNYKNGRYDEEEIAHKIITKMQMLAEENEELSKMLSYGKSKEKDIEIGLLRKQKAELSEKVSKLELKLSNDNP